MTVNNEGWKSSEAARHHMRTADILVPGRKDSLEMVARLATEFAPPGAKFMEIGCGFGDLTAEILEIDPSATVTMIDYSEEMLRLTHDRFGTNPGITTIEYDLNQGIPDRVISQKYDAVVSSYALHHVEFENRVNLYSQVRRVLEDNGLFIVADRFTGDSPLMREWEFDNWMRWMSGSIKENMGNDVPFEEVKRRQLATDAEMGDKPGTVWDMQRDLKQAGFTHVDCLWKIFNMSIIAAAGR